MFVGGDLVELHDDMIAFQSELLDLEVESGRFGAFVDSESKYNHNDSVGVLFNFLHSNSATSVSSEVG